MKLSFEYQGKKEIIDIALPDGKALAKMADGEFSFDRLRGLSSHTLFQNGMVTQVCILRRHSGDKVDVLVNGNFHTLAVVDEKRKSSSSTSLASAKEIKAVMPGRVVKVHVKEGQAIATGDPVLVLEAMKMENEIKAATDGTLEKVFVKEGDTVETGAMLMRIA